MSAHRRVFSAGVLAVSVCLAAPAPGAGPTFQDVSPTSWDVRLTVSARGEYGHEGRDVRIDGRYEFAIVWTGALHVDDEDYLLVHGGTAVTDWTAEEKSLASEDVTILTAGDFRDKPELRVNYILRMADGLHVDFIVRGFEVPLGAAADRFYLHLPASADNGENAGDLKYGLSLASGSNAVVLDEKAIRRGPAEETFRWTWKRRSWVQRQDQTILQTQSHSAKIKVAIVPKPVRPGDGIDRTPGGAVRG